MTTTGKIHQGRSLTVSEDQAAEGGDGDKDGADGVQSQGEPARGGEEEEPRLCTRPRGEDETLGGQRPQHRLVETQRKAATYESAGPGGRQRTPGTSARL